MPAELDATPTIAINAETDQGRYDGAVDLYPDYEGMCNLLLCRHLVTPSMQRLTRADI
jgi:hypothetical protein